MLNLGFLGFASPWMLLALLSLPLLWYLLRVTPPAPRRQVFPAIRLLIGLRPQEETPARTPWWLLLLRLVIAGFVILALSRPILNPAAPWGGDGPMVLVVDDGWASARDWDARMEAASALLQQAERLERPVLLLTTAATAEQEAERLSLRPLPAAQVRQQLATLQPKPWPPDRAALVERLEGLTLNGTARVFWLSDGLQAKGTAHFVERLRRFGPITMLRATLEDLPLVLLPPESQATELVVRALRVPSDFAESAIVRAVDADGYEVGSLELIFEPGEEQAAAPLELPLELRNRIERLRIEREQGAGAILLLDEYWRRRPVGLVDTRGTDGAQPLLDEHYYLERALEPFTEIYRGSLDLLLERRPAVIVLADQAVSSSEEETALREWLEEGGLLLRFAGPRLLEGELDSLLPVELRSGGRTLGGPLAWDRPAGLGDFPESGPLSGLQVPDDVVVRQQVLAEPALDLAEKTWAQLADGTPLVTAARLGAGWIVLVHTTANAEWSNLALSGLFVEMLQRLVALSEGVPAAREDLLPPLSVLDGFGRLIAPPPTVRPLPAEREETVAIGPANPPGFYGEPLARRALNLSSAIERLEPLPEVMTNVTMVPYRMEREQSLLPWLLTLAFILALIDQLLGLALRGLLPGFGRHRSSARGALQGPAAGVVLLFALLLLPSSLQAQGAEGLSGAGDEFALRVLAETRLAYLLTGDSEQDEMSRAGMMGLSQMLIRRTTIEPAEPVGVRPGRDELAFFPLIYWPVFQGQAGLDEAARDALNSYLEHGGTLLIDLLRPDALQGFTGDGSDLLRRMTEGIEVPPLQAVPPDHVLTKAFYLLQEFPGRYSGGALWVEETDERRHDGVATVILGGNDWAAAWAVDEMGRPLAAVVPGGERQREIAYRFGINLVMYALTGNYKADQVHVPFILERLGQ